VGHYTFRLCHKKPSNVNNQDVEQLFPYNNSASEGPLVVFTTTGTVLHDGAFQWTAFSTPNGLADPLVVITTTGTVLTAELFHGQHLLNPMGSLI
jgi:hypothetical protein